MVLTIYSKKYFSISTSQFSELVLSICLLESQHPLPKTQTTSAHLQPVVVLHNCRCLFVKRLENSIEKKKKWVSRVEKIPPLLITEFCWSLEIKVLATVTALFHQLFGKCTK